MASPPSPPDSTTGEGPAGAGDPAGTAGGAAVGLLLTNTCRAAMRGGTTPARCVPIAIRRRGASASAAPSPVAPGVAGASSGINGDEDEGSGGVCPADAVSAISGAGGAAPSVVFSGSAVTPVIPLQTVLKRGDEHLHMAARPLRPSRKNQCGKQDLNLHGITTTSPSS